MNRSIYLDYAAATPLDPAVKAAMEPYFSDKFYNPSALYLASKAVSADVGQARAQVARCLGARPAEIIFTAGGTEANNLAIHGVMSQYPSANIVTSAVEHESVLQPASLYERRLAPVLENGRVDLTALKAIIDDQTALVSIMYANNEVGTIQPLKDIAQLINTLRQGRLKRGNKLPLYLHSDACQAANHLDLQTARLGVDLLTLNGGKIYGPKQSGALYVRAGIKLQPQVLGGGQEQGLRSGTENVPGIVGLATALDKAQSKRHAETKRLSTLQQQFLNAVKTELPEAIINGSLKHRLPNNVHLTFPGKDNERLLMELDEQGIMCAAGSACTASSEEPSHVLKAMGIKDSDAQASLRFTMGRGTIKTDIERVVAALKSL
jgi:cysteine desulfurase